MDKMVMILRKQTFKNDSCSGCMFENYLSCVSEQDAIKIIGLGDCVEESGNNYIYVKGEINFE